MTIPILNNLLVLFYCVSQCWSSLQISHKSKCNEREVSKVKKKKRMPAKQWQKRHTGRSWTTMTHCYHERAWVLTWTLPLLEHKRTIKKEGLWFFFSPFSLTWQSQWCLLIASLYYWFKFWQWWALELWKKVSQENLEILETQKSYTGWKHPHKMLQEESNINLTALLNQIFSTSDFSS